MIKQMRTRKALLVLFWAAAATFAAGQSRRHDPLTELEIDKIRDAAQLPEARLKLYVEFARARLDKLNAIRSDPKISDRAAETRNALQDFLDVYDELNTNVDTYADRGSDLRKALKPVIGADTEFGAKLRAFKSSLAPNPEEAQADELLLGSALDAVDGGAKEHRELLAEQEESFKHKKKQPHPAEASRPQ
jgi:hypothetical protein